jgi:hypothetical protein
LPQPRYPRGYWDEAFKYLRDCYILQHNDDYLEFLVTRVWGLKESCRLVEFGCGAGKMGMKLLSIQCIFPPVDTDYKRKLFKAICDEGYGQPQPNEAQKARWKANLMEYGLAEPAAKAEIERELEEGFLNRGRQYHTMNASMLTWSFGTVHKYPQPGMNIIFGVKFLS